MRRDACHFFFFLGQRTRFDFSYSELKSKSKDLELESISYFFNYFELIVSIIPLHFLLLNK